MSNTSSTGDFDGSLLYRMVKVRPHELTAVVISFLYVFALMTGWYVLRPIRDSMASDYSDFERSLLFTGTFVFSIAALIVYGYACSRIRLSTLLPWVYAFFGLNILGFYFAFSAAPDNLTISTVFFIWTSVFNLFVVSVFWSFMADIWSKEQSKRLFGFIAGGASVGAIAGPSITLLLVEPLGSTNLMLVSATLTAIPIIFIRMLIGHRRRQGRDAGTPAVNGFEQTIGGNPFAGITLFFQNRYLFGIGMFIVIYSFMNTLIWFQLADMLEPMDRDARVRIWSLIDWFVNVLALGTQAFATSRLATRFGLGITLALVPVLMIGGLLVVAITPILSVLVGLQILRRAGNYAITKPGRDMLFTILDPESKYKVKSVIDTVVYRGGDAGSAWAITGLKEIFNLGISGVAVVGAGLAAVWAVTGLALGRQYERHETLDAHDAKDAKRSQTAPAE